MIPARRALLGCLGVLLLSGCAYYNSMYYANRYTREAERAQRSGRAAEARERWRQAAIHAESLLARHPDSKWADDAMLVRGRAFVGLRSWSEAVVALDQAVRAAPNAEQRRTALLYQGEANFGLRRLPQALEALDEAVALRNAAHRSRARLARGRVLLAMGRPADALRDLLASRERAAGAERTRAALALGDMRLAAAYADTMARAEDEFVEVEWTAILDTLARVGLDAEVTRLVDRLEARDDAGRGARARLLLAEGDRRLAAGDDSAATGRFRAVQRLVPDSVEARAAWLRLTRLELAAVTGSADLERIRQRLEIIAALGGEPSRGALLLGAAIDLADTLATAAGPADAFAFLRAELLRDSVGARRMAAEAFAAMAEEYPASPWAPKALVAAITSGHPSSDSLRTVLAARYADSPYAAAAAGRAGDLDRYAVLEDSLTAALALAPGVRAVPARPGFAAPAAQGGLPGLRAPGSLPTGLPANTPAPQTPQPTRSRNPDP